VRRAEVYRPPGACSFPGANGGGSACGEFGFDWGLELDIIHLSLLALQQARPELFTNHRIAREAPGVYILDGHEVTLEWQPSPESGRKPGHLLVVDGPLRQPLADYLTMSEVNAEYDTHALEKTSALHHVPKERRMTFDDEHAKYSRLEAMRVAKEQATLRERAADYIKEGKQVPEDLVKKYKKALRRTIKGAKAKQPAEVQDENQKPPTNILPDAEKPFESAEAKPAEGRCAAGLGRLGGGGVATQALGQEQHQFCGQRQPPQLLDSVNGPAPATGAQVPAVSLVVHRGHSLHSLPGSIPSTPVPSFQPPPLAHGPPPHISRSWSGTSMSMPMSMAMQPSYSPPAATGMVAVPTMARTLATSTVPPVATVAAGPGSRLGVGASVTPNPGSMTLAVATPHGTPHGSFQQSYPALSFQPSLAAVATAAMRR
jgi:hypothetical protein